MTVLLLLACGSPDLVDHAVLPPGVDPSVAQPEEPTGPGAGERQTVASGPMFTGPDELIGVSGFGARVGAAGDVNGDGYADLLVADDVNEAVYVYAGSASGISTTSMVTLGHGGGDGFGASIAGGGDVNVDGYDDIVVGRPDASGGRGCVDVYYGSATGPSTSPSWVTCGRIAQGLGVNVAMPGDVDGDGRDDLAIQHQEAAGSRVILYQGGTRGLRTRALSSVNLGAGYVSPGGEALRGAGDVNADGYADVVVGAQDSITTAGSVRVLYGSATGLSLGSSTRISLTNSYGDVNWGHSVHTAGDFDGDGYDDVIVGAPWDYYGHAGILYGSATGVHSTDMELWVGEVGADAAGTLFGYSVAGGGDFDGDGYDDVAVGAPGRWNGGYGIPAGDWGATEIFRGSAIGLDPLYPYIGISWDTPDADLLGESFSGRSIAVLGDVDGDGCDDLVDSEGEYGPFPGIGFYFEVNVYYGTC